MIHDTMTREDMICYIHCTLESATTRQIEEVFYDACATLDIEASDEMTAFDMVSELEYSFDLADDRQIEDVYWAVLMACD